MTTPQGNGPSPKSYLDILSYNNPAAEEANDSGVSETLSHAVNPNGIINKGDRSHPCFGTEINPLPISNYESDEPPGTSFTKVSRGIVQKYFIMSENSTSTKCCLSSTVYTLLHCLYFHIIVCAGI